MIMMYVIMVNESESHGFPVFVCNNNDDDNVPERRYFIVRLCETNEIEKCLYNPNNIERGSTGPCYLFDDADGVSTW